MRRMTYALTYVLGAMLLLIAIAATLVYAVPAAWVAAYVAHASGGRVQIAHARGLWHSGSGNLVLAGGAGGATATHWPQRLTWRIRPRGLLQWHLRLTLPEAGAPLEATLRTDLSGWAVDIAPWRGVIPLQALAGLGAPFNTLALEGDARIALAQVNLSSADTNSAKPAAAPNVEIDIARLRSALAQGVVLGDYAVRGTAAAGGASFNLRTLQGALLLDGAGQCTISAIKNRLACGFAGTARAARHDDALLGNLLGLLDKSSLPPGGATPVTELRW